MGTAQVEQGSFDNAHGQPVGMFTELHHAQVQQQLTNIESRLQHTQGADIRVLLEHAINRLLMGVVKGYAQVKSRW